MKDINTKITRYATTEVASGERYSFACTFIQRIARIYWDQLKKATGIKWQFKGFRTCSNLSDYANDLAVLWAERIMANIDEVGYEISVLYASLLPKEYCVKFGVFYTPISIVNRMLDNSERLGIDFKKAKVIDPASGGSAFLANLCKRMINVDHFPDFDMVVKDLAKRLKGVDVDPFAAWLSQFVLECELAYLVPGATSIPIFVSTSDSLRLDSANFGQYDLVIGNPPYGKIAVDDYLTERFGQSFFGHVNIYQIFYHLAFLLTKPEGMVHLLTPTSFLGGQYSSKLRRIIGEQAYPCRFEIVKERLGVFKGVQQEVVASIFKKGQEVRHVPVYLVSSDKNWKSLKLVETGKAIITRDLSNPWQLPRDEESGRLLNKLSAELVKLSDLGFRATTGYFVWNRNRDKLRMRRSSNFMPLIWSDSILSDGRFDFYRARKNGKKIWVSPKGIELNALHWPAVAVKRTTNIEQKRRVYAAVIPDEFLRLHGAYLVENHVNIVIRVKRNNLKLATLSRFLNSKVVDDIFRCMSGTVAVSVTELMNLSLPCLNNLLDFQEVFEKGGSSDELEQMALDYYKS